MSGIYVVPNSGKKNSYTKYVNSSTPLYLHHSPDKWTKHDKFTRVYPNQCFCIMVKYANKPARPQQQIKKLIY